MVHQTVEEVRAVGAPHPTPHPRAGTPYFGEAASQEKGSSMFLETRRPLVNHKTTLHCTSGPIVAVSSEMIFLCLKRQRHMQPP